MCRLHRHGGIDNQMKLYKAVVARFTGFKIMKTILHVLNDLFEAWIEARTAYASHYMIRKGYK